MATKKTHLSFREFISNPSGKGSAVNTNSELILSNYSNKVAVLEKITYTCYMNNNGVYYIHFIIPSDSVEGCTYDLVVQLSPGKNPTPMDQYEVKFFSNDPAFVFTYAYAYKSHGLLIEFLEKKYTTQTTTSRPSTRNPDNAIGIPKSIYYAYIIMNKKGLFDNKNVDRFRVVNSHPENVIYNKVRKYAEIENERSINQKKSKTKSISLDVEVKNNNLLTKGVRAVAKVSPIRAVKGIGRVVKGVKRTKKF